MSPADVGKIEAGRLVPYESQLDNIKAKVKPVEELERTHPEAKQLIASRVGYGEEILANAKWLPVKHKSGFWTALFDERSAHPIEYLPLDPY